MRKLVSVITLMVIIIVIFISTFGYLSLNANRPASPPEDGQMAGIVISDNGGSRISFKAEIADTPEEQRTGLMNRTSLDDGSGMLFVFDGDDYRTFWMEDTLIPLDMIFITSDYRIVDIHENAVPLDRTVITSAGRCKYVLEINGGLCDRLGIDKGDTVRISSLV